MRFSLLLENDVGTQINMTSTANRYMVSEIDGLYPPSGTISTSAYAGMDGSYLNNAFIEKRNLVITFQMRGCSIEECRHELYRVVKPSRYIKVYYKTSKIDVYTEGYVENCTVSNFSNQTSGQISIICPDPYWYSQSIKYAYFGRLMGAFTFPFPKSDAQFPLGVYNIYSDITSIFNNGDEIGFTIRIETDLSPNAPEIAANGPTIQLLGTKQYFRIGSSILKGDVIIITTKTGQKTMTLIRNGVETNIIANVVSGSSWLTLKPGENKLRVESAGSLKFTFIHSDAYLGV